MEGDSFLERPQLMQMPCERGTVVCLPLVFVLATLGPAEDDLSEDFLIGGHVLLEVVQRLLVILTGLLPTEAAAIQGESC